MNPRKRKIRKIAIISLIVSLLCIGGFYGKNKSDSREPEAEQAVAGEQADSATTEPQADLSVSEQQAELEKTEADTAKANIENTAIEDELGYLNVHFIDVGQGDSTLIDCNGHYMLIDAGDMSKGTTVQLYLNKQEVDKIDVLLLTHPDSDHIGGADVIVTKYDIDNIYMPSIFSDSKAYEELIGAIDYRNYKYESPAAGYSFYLDRALITFVGPTKEYASINDNSYIVKIEFGNTSFILTGDAEKQSEMDMIGSNIDMSANVYKAGHHGSSTSTCKELLDAINPEYVVISCGVNNSYGHPHAETLELLKSNDIKVYRTDEQGSITACSNGYDITWSCEPSVTWSAGVVTDTGNNTIVTTTPDANYYPDIYSAPAVTVPEIAEVSENMVWIPTNGGTKYHKKETCSKMQNPMNVSIEQAIMNGYEPCGKCYK